MIVLVTGDRNWPSKDIVWMALQQQFITKVIEGCAHGADRFAEQWCAKFNVPDEHHPADWVKYGRPAGPIRNREMLAAGPDIVLAFHPNLDKSKGTKDMVTIAQKAGIPVLLYGYDFKVTKL